MTSEFRNTVHGSKVTRNGTPDPLPTTNIFPRVSNSVVLAALLNEIYFDILEYSRICMQYRFLWIRKKTGLIHDRRLTLSALSQTCRSLRKFFLSYLWERIELYYGMRMEGGVALLPVEDELLVRELTRQLETPTKQNPDLAQHVRCVTVIFIPMLSPLSPLIELW